MTPATKLRLALVALLCGWTARLAARLGRAEDLPSNRGGAEFEKLERSSVDWANWAREQLREGARLAR